MGEVKDKALPKAGRQAGAAATDINGPLALSPKQKKLADKVKEQWEMYNDPAKINRARAERMERLRRKVMEEFNKYNKAAAITAA